MKKTPKPQFRGNWIRPEIFMLVETGRIAIREAWLLLLIDNLVKHGGQDCFASNKYFAKRLQCPKRKVGEMIQNLRTLGLVVQTRFDGRRRHIRTVWSRIEVLDSNTSAMLDSRIADMREVRTHSTTSVAVQDNCVGGTRRAIRIRKNHAKQNATLLLEAWSKIRKVSPRSKPHTWATAFRLLHEYDKVPQDRIATVLRWYCETLKKTGDPIRANPLYLPIAQTGQKFRLKFDAIEEAMGRLSKKQDQHKGPKVTQTIVGDILEDEELPF